MHANPALDVIRGLAALLVLIAHARRSTFQMDYIGQFPESLLGTLLILPTTVAREAVAVFFVLSGYLVGGQVIRGVSAGRFSWPSYLSSRLSRLWTVLIPALFLTAVLNVIGHSLYPGEFSQVPGGDAELKVTTAACNAIFLMHAQCVPFGSNGPLWTLAFEFWFYILFAAFATLWAALRGRKALLGLTMVATIIAGTLLFGVQVYLYAPAWLMGVVIAWLQPRIEVSSIAAAIRRRYTLSLVVSVGILGAGFVVSNIIRQGYPITLGFMGLATVPLATVVILNPGHFSGRRTAVLAGLGTISYSLYAFHTPIIELLIAAGSGLWSTDLGRVAALYVMSAIVVVIVVPLWWLTERHTPTVRRWFRVILSGRKEKVGA